MHSSPKSSTRGDTVPLTGLDRAVAPAVRRRIGLNVHAIDAPAIALLKRLGVTDVRTTLYWRLWSPSYESPFAAALERLKAAEMRAVVVVHSPPIGMSLAEGSSAMPTFLAARARELRGVSWQVMNEMDGDDGFNNAWFGAADRRMSQEDRGAAYAQLIAPVHDAVKGADPTAAVVTGGVALEPTGFHTGLADHASSKYDAFCVHCYGEPILVQFRAKSMAMRAVLAGAPLWCTEFGDHHTDQARQAAGIATVLDDNDANDRYDRCHLYALIDDVEHYGIASPDGTLHQAASLLMGRVGP